ncbi:MAG: helix-turn-helix domain-containing protein [Bacillota bacterium]
MTIRELAKLVGLSPENVGKLEADKINASLPTLKYLSEILCVSVAYLGCFEKLPEITLGQRIRKARLYHGLTKKDFAKSIGVSEKAIWWWEQDQYEPLKKYHTALDQYLAIINKTFN